MAELPKDIYPTVSLGFLLSGRDYGKESRERRRKVPRNNNSSLRR